MVIVFCLSIYVQNAVESSVRIFGSQHVLLLSTDAFKNRLGYCRRKTAKRASLAELSFIISELLSLEQAAVYQD